MYEFVQYLYPILVGLASGWIASATYFRRLLRRCTELEWAIGDLQQRASSFKGKELAEKRWSKEKAFDAEVAQMMQQPQASRRKYDNDPLGTD